MMTFCGPCEARRRSSKVQRNFASTSGDTLMPGCDGAVWKRGPQSSTRGSARPFARAVPGSGVAYCTAGHAAKRSKRSSAKASVALISSALSPGMPMM